MANITTGSPGFPNTIDSYTAQAADNDILHTHYNGLAEAVIALQEHTFGWINVAKYGASPSASASTNSNAIQAAFNDAATARVGEIIFPPGLYNYDTPLVLSPSSSQMHVNLIGVGGSGFFGTTLNYTGSSGVGLTIANNTRYVAKNLRLHTDSPGTTGLHLTSLTTGSNHGSCVWENCTVSGFATGIQLGATDNKACSEVTFNRVEVEQCSDAGLLILGPTAGPTFTTNIWMKAFNAILCGTALRYSGPADANQTVIGIDGSSIAASTLCEFDLQNPCMFYARNLYTEGPLGQLVRSGSANATLNSAVVTKVSLENCFASYTASPLNEVVQFNQPGDYFIRGCSLSTGSIILGGFDGGGGSRNASLIVEGSTIVSASARIQYRASSNTIWNVRHFASGYTTQESQNQDTDRHYRINADGSETAL